MWLLIESLTRPVLVRVLAHVLGLLQSVPMGAMRHWCRNASEHVRLLHIIHKCSICFAQFFFSPFNFEHSTSERTIMLLHIGH